MRWLGRSKHNYGAVYGARYQVNTTGLGTLGRLPTVEVYGYS